MRRSEVEAAIVISREQMIAVANAEMQSLVKLSKDLANQNGYLAKELKSLQDVAQKKPNVEEQTGLLRAEVRELEHELRQRNQEQIVLQKEVPRNGVGAWRLTTCSPS